MSAQTPSNYEPDSPIEITGGIELSPLSAEHTVDGKVSALTAQLLDEILTKAHPLLKEGLYLLALIDRCTEGNFIAMRQRDDGRDMRLLQRLLKFSFVNLVEWGDIGEPVYQVSQVERELLRTRFIAEDGAAFIEAHARALTHTVANPHPDPFVQDQNRIFHKLIADGAAGMADLDQTFFGYTDERQMAAAERLVNAAEAAEKYTKQLGLAHSAELKQWSTYLEARLYQYRGRWDDSKARLVGLLEDPDLADSIRPNLERAYGRAQARDGDFVGAINSFEQASAGFKARGGDVNQEAFTQLAAGDAYAGIASSARGYRQYIADKPSNIWESFLAKMPPAAPLLAYVGYHFGWQACHPRSWPALRDQDWVVSRLYSMGASEYRAADAKLESLEKQANHVAADEKLGRLYLSMGDSAQALPIFEQILSESEAPLTEYKRARTQVGYAEALLQQQRPHDAIAQLEPTLPLLRGYEDFAELAKANALLAQCYAVTDQHAEAGPRFAEAVGLYNRSRDDGAITELVERQPDAEQAAVTGSIANLLYGVRFEHPSLALFRRLVLIALSILFFLLPLLVVSIKLGGQLAPSITPIVPPLLEYDSNRDLSINSEFAVAPNVDQLGITQVDAQVVLWIGVLGLLLYALLIGWLGYYIVSRIRLETVQNAQKSAVRINPSGITVGGTENSLEFKWDEIKEVVSADTTLGGKLLNGQSYTTLVSADKRAIISGNTTLYQQLKERITRYAPSAKTTKLDAELMFSNMGIMYMIGLALIVLSAVIGRLSPQTLQQPILPSVGLIGRLTWSEIYPFFFLFIFIPPLWWHLLRPVRLRTKLRTMKTSPLWTGAIALILVAMRLLNPSTAWFTVPDIYPPLLIILFAISSALLFWYAPERVDGALTQANKYSNGVRYGVAVLATAIVLYAGSILFQQMYTYTFLLRGNGSRDAAIEAKTAADRLVLQNQATTNYNRVLALSNNELSADCQTAISRGSSLANICDVVEGSESWNFGFPARDEIPDINALYSLATIYAEQERFEEALASYAQIESTLRPPNVFDYASRALVYQRQAAALGPDADEDELARLNELASADYDKAIDEDPSADNYLWRGIFKHSNEEYDDALLDYERSIELNDANPTAWLWQGWAEFALAIENEDDDLFEAAKASFEESAELEESAEAYLGIGYAQFRLGNRDSAADAWLRTKDLQPDDPIMIISSGTANWIKGTPGGVDACSSNDLSQDEIVSAENSLYASVADLTEAIERDVTNAVTYRTRAQVRYLLRNCPNTNFIESMAAAVDDYTLSLEQDPGNWRNWQTKARIAYSLSISDKANAGNWLEIASVAIEAAVEIDGEEQSNKNWEATITGNTDSVLLEEGLNLLEQGEPEQAYAEFERVITEHPTIESAHFRAGYTAVILGRLSEAGQHYANGVRYSLRSTSTIADGGANDLAELLAANPEVDVMEVFAAIENSSAELTSNWPDLNNNATYFWHRARFMFTLGNETFKLHPTQAESAEQIAAEIAPIIQRAATLNNAACGNCELWADFMGETLYGWNHLRRGDDHFDAGNFEAALADYQVAAQQITLVEGFPTDDAIEARFDLVLAYVAVGDEDSAENALQDAQNFLNTNDLDPNDTIVVDQISKRREQITTAPDNKWDWMLPIFDAATQE